MGVTQDCCGRQMRRTERGMALGSSYAIYQCDKCGNESAWIRSEAPPGFYLAAALESKSEKRLRSTV